MQSHLQCQQQLHDILKSLQPLFEEGLSEYELITLLKSPPHQVFNVDALSDSLVLFQTHFVLFHTLYMLRSEWRSQNVGELDIVTTNIKLRPNSSSAGNEIDTPDPLSQYYLNWDNLNSTKQHDVDELLNSFWVQMVGNHTLAAHSAEAIKDATEVFEFTPNEADNMSLETIKLQYRKLQHRYHPDKGGNTQDAQLITQAYRVLRDTFTRQPK